MMKSSDIRQAFIDFFVAKNHQKVESSSLVPAQDPSLLFTNAGMVQFKDFFLGLETPSFNTAVSSQRCLRAGGKHNDLENVGYTARHHTFFEMLGNFSFGAYFKREAIAYAWEFLTKVLKLPPERLWVTVYVDDDEAADIWLKEMKVSKERFSRCTEDNFWAMGDTGPCGPCTEIFYDHGPEVPGGPPGSPEAEKDRYIEIWNLVFMQYNRDKSGKLHPLPKPSVDTGMGLERITAVVQGVHNNYDIDSFAALIKSILALTPKTEQDHPSLKVIADHIRACAFLITDGVIPSNEGRGYVLRRIIRRALRHGSKLGLPTPFFYLLVQPLVKVMGEAYPELKNSEETIERLLKQEELLFVKTLEQGLQVFQEHLPLIKGEQISGELAFKLYDTYGFPLDLTQDLAREYSKEVDLEGFSALMESARKLSQAASAFANTYISDGLVEESSEFHGYEKTILNSEIKAIFKQDKKVQSLHVDEEAGIILKDTPFYAESGGQAGDHGYLTTPTASFQVSDTQKVGKAIIHYGKLIKGSLKINDSVKAEIETKRRNAIRLNHTATHLVHAALRKVLGKHVQQKGSLVEACRARFDFSHQDALSAEQIQEVEALVNTQIRANTQVDTANMSLAEAKTAGALALFGEKYSETSLRVLSIGEFSKELCGGTHATRTGDIGIFKIVAEYGVASGVRRVEFITGEAAYLWISKQLDIFKDVQTQLKTNSEQVISKLTLLIQESKLQQKELTNLQAKLSSKSTSGYLDKVEKIGQVSLLIQELEADSKTLRTTLDDLKSRLDSAVIILYSKDAKTISVVAGVSKSLLGKVPPAPIYVKHLCGKGGGRDDMAQGGGELPANLEEKISELKSMLQF